MGPIPGLRRSPGGGNGNPLQYSCLKKCHGQRSLAGSPDPYSPWGHKESNMIEQLSRAAYFINLYLFGNGELTNWNIHVIKKYVCPISR